MIDKDLPEMPCRELVELVTDYLEDRLSPLDRARFEAHLASARRVASTWSSFVRHPGARPPARGVALSRGPERAAYSVSRLVPPLHFSCNAGQVCGTHVRTQT